MRVTGKVNFRFAFAFFGTAEDAKKAYVAAQGATVNDLKLLVMYAKKKSEKQQKAKQARERVKKGETSER